MSGTYDRLAVRCIARGFSALLIACGLMLSANAQTKPADSSAAYLDTSLPLEQRVDDLVSRMTIEEKVLQMQSNAPAIPRLGVPSYVWQSEALHGVARTGYATVFPQAIGMGATWDIDLVHREGETIATEGRAKYNEAQREGYHGSFFGLDYWSPNINIFRDPRWGRGQETYGEDPYLTAKMGVAFVTGLQGTDPKYLKAISTPKHYAVHSGPELLRHEININASPHDVEDTYLPAFRATIVEGHADSVMCAYNAVDGTPACANKFLLQDTLRDAWKFQGYVTSDCGAIRDITNGHKFTPDNEHGSALAVQAGTDTTCGSEYVALAPAVHEGLIKESEIDTAVKRLLTARFRLGMFDPPNAVAFNRIPLSEADSPPHRQLALRAARESIVLLKNDGFLPLKSNIKALAVIGPNAESIAALEGNYYGTPPHPVFPLEGIQKIFDGKVKIVSAQGSPYVVQLPVPVPSSIFHTAEARAIQGLKGEYFANTDFSGKPVLTRVDPTMQFDWNVDTPAPEVPRKTFSVRWTGTLTPPGAGDYEFSIQRPHNGSDGKETIRIYLDGDVVFDTTMGPRGMRNAPTSFHFRFDDQRPHPFRFDYAHDAPRYGAELTLDWQPPVEALRDEAVKVAQQADAVVAFVGIWPHLEGEEMAVNVPGFHGGDRTDIALPEPQQQLLEALAATGKPLVVVVMSGSPIAVNWAQEHAAAVLEAWYPGEEGGTAIAETLAGINNPSGRLPLTFYKSLDQLPPFEDYSMQNRTYRYFQGKPLYGFGYGLSYSKFEYSNLHVSSPQIQAGAPLAVQVDVRNTSKITGDEVAELYLEFPSIPGAPRRALRGIARAHLLPAQTRHLTFTLEARDLSMVSEQGEHLVAPGEYIVFVGGAQPGDTAGGAKAKLTIDGEMKLPR